MKNLTRRPNLIAGPWPGDGGSCEGMFLSHVQQGISPGLRGFVRRIKMKKLEERANRSLDRLAKAVEAYKRKVMDQGFDLEGYLKKTYGGGNE